MEHLRCPVEESTSLSPHVSEFSSFSEATTDSEVNDLESARLLVEKNVLWFDVPVNNVIAVEVAKSTKKFSHDSLDGLLRMWLSFGYSRP